MRAETSCLRCHEDKNAGDLLGAFSYVVREAEYQRTAFGAKRPPGPVERNPEPKAVP